MGEAVFSFRLRYNSCLILGSLLTAVFASEALDTSSLADAGVRQEGGGGVIRGTAALAKRADDVTPLVAVVQQQAHVIEVMQAEMAALKADVTALKSQASKAAAFSVSFTTDPIDDVGLHAILIFDRVTCNVGNAYNVNTGIFSAPVEGLYVFYVNLMGSDTQGALDVAVVKSGTMLDLAWTQGQGDLYDQGSCLVTTHLSAGEQVWVRHLGGATAFRGGRYTTFSGFLVHAD